MATMRFWFRGALSKRKDTATGRLQQLTGELALLYSGLAGCASLLWYLYGPPMLAPFEGAARLTLLRRMGHNLYLSPCILFQDPSLKLYSTLDGNSGECYCWAVDYRGDVVYSTRLGTTSSLEESLDKIAGYRTTTKVAANKSLLEKETSASSAFDEDSGPLYAVGRWWKYMQLSYVDMAEARRQKFDAQENGEWKYRCGNYLTDTFIWMARQFSNTVSWTAMYPVKAFFRGGKAEEAIRPAIHAENPTTEQWKAVLVKHVVNGVPNTEPDAKERNFFVSQDREQVMVSFKGAQMLLNRDAFATARVRETRALYGKFLLAWCTIPSFFMFGSWWYDVLSKATHDAVYKNLAARRSQMTKRFVGYSIWKTIPLRFLAAFGLVGHYLYETSYLDPYVLGTFVAHNVVVEAVAAWWVFGYALRRAQPTSLALLKEAGGPGKPAPVREKSFVTTRRPAGNLSANDLIEHDMCLSVSDKQFMTVNEVADRKQSEWLAMMGAHDAVQKAVAEADAKREQQRLMKEAEAERRLEAAATADAGTPKLPPKPRTPPPTAASA